MSESTTSNVLLTDALIARVGESVTYTSPEPLSRASIRYFALAVGDLNPIYLDDEAAKSAGLDGIVAPPTLITETNQYMTTNRDEDGFMGHSWHLDVPDSRLVRGGNTYEFSQYARPDDVVTSTWTIADMIERRTSKGVPMLVVTSEAVYRNQRGETICTNTESLVFTSLLAPPAAATGGVS